MEMHQQEATIKIRIDAATADLLERARQYTRLDKSKFIRQSVREKAESVIAEHEKTQFSVEDWHAFFIMLDTPPRPTARMRKAAVKYRDITAS